MCGTCGCSKSMVRAQPAPAGRLAIKVDFSEPDPTDRRERLERAVLDKNDLLAARNREHFKARSLLAINFMSSPGSGKTTLLERTIARMAGGTEPSPVFVIQGDQATDHDAARVRQAGAQAPGHSQ